MNKISIIITNYNRVNFIDRAIRSCLDQSVSVGISLEIIIVDDCSTDDSLKLLEMFKDDITLVKHAKNLGVAAASNSGIKHSTGDYIIRLDADDFLNKYALQILSSLLDENEDYGFVYTDHFRVDERGFKQEKKKLDNDEALYNHGAGVLFRKAIVDKIGFYDESLANCEDYDFLIRMKKHFKGLYLPLPLYRYHIHGDNLSLRGDREAFKKIVRSNHGI